MKKLLALLAVLGMVSVASATSTTFSVVKGGTALGIIGSETSYQEATFDVYYLCADVSGNLTGDQFNALDLYVVSDGNVVALTGGMETNTYVDPPVTQRSFALQASTTPGSFGKVILQTTPGQSGLDLRSNATPTVGSIFSGSPDPGEYVFAYVDNIRMAFASKSAFSSAFNTAGDYGAVVDNQLATIYLKAGTTGTATLTGSAGGLNGPAIEVGTVALPEPATLSVLAIGALGLIRRKLA